MKFAKENERIDEETRNEKLKEEKERGKEEADTTGS